MATNFSISSLLGEPQNKSLEITVRNLHGLGKNHLNDVGVVDQGHDNGKYPKLVVLQTPCLLLGD